METSLEKLYVDIGTWAPAREQNTAVWHEMFVGSKFRDFFSDPQK